MLDMSKPFDTIKRELLIQDLKRIINQGELHLFKIILNTQEDIKRAQLENKIDFLQRTNYSMLNTEHPLAKNNK